METNLAKRIARPIRSHKSGKCPMLSEGLLSRGPFRPLEPKGAAPIIGTGFALVRRLMMDLESFRTDEAATGDLFSDIWPEVRRPGAPLKSARGASPLRWPGGKGSFVPAIHRILSKGLPHPEVVVEPFAGGAAFTIACLEAGYGKRLVLADLDPMVYAFWRIVFSSEGSKLAQLARSAELTLAEYDSVKASRPEKLIDLAFKCLYLNRTSFSGIIHPKAGPIGGRAQSGKYTVGVRFRRETIAGRIEELSNHRDRVSVLHSDWRKTISNTRKHAEQATAWYFDPPFFKKADVLYNHAFDTAEHRALKGALEGLGGSWVLSYDVCEEARELYGAHPGYREIDAVYQVKVRKTSGAKTKEILVSNVL